MSGSHRTDDLDRDPNTNGQTGPSLNMWKKFEIRLTQNIEAQITPTQTRKKKSLGNTPMNSSHQIHQLPNVEPDDKNKQTK